MKKIIFLFLTLFTLQGFAQEVSKEYDKIGKFYHGVAIVWKNGLCGVIKSNGKEIVKPEYEKIRPFGSDGISYTTKEGKTGLLSIEGKVIAIISDGDETIPAMADDVFAVPPADEIVAPMLSVIPLQLLSYYIGVAKGCDVDKPRNLAKSVTVE